MRRAVSVRRYDDSGFTKCMQWAKKYSARKRFKRRAVQKGVTEYRITVEIGAHCRNSVPRDSDGTSHQTLAISP